VNLDDYLDYLTECVFQCAGDVVIHDAVVFEEEQQGHFEAIINFPSSGHKLCVGVDIALGGERGQADPFWYRFHFQDKDGNLVERWDCDPHKKPCYHRHKPRR
jgi:hypothetical protein